MARREECDAAVKPGSSRNPINLGAKGVIPVAILGSPALDVTQIDASSIRFGPGAASVEWFDFELWFVRHFQRTGLLGHNRSGQERRS
jgi:hypothetical protein